MTNVFISYARKDARDVAVLLRDALQKAGYAVWLDLREVELGGDFSVEIEHAIDECDVTLALLTDGANASKWCRMEQLRALRKGKKIIPLRLTATIEPPLYLEHLNALDFSNPDTRDAMQRDLLSDIASSQAFRSAKADIQSNAFKPTKKTGRVADEKRNAPAFRRHIRALRATDWGGRNWWTYFLFRTVTLEEVVNILHSGVMTPPASKSRSQWDKMLSFHFRPRHPELFEVEGFMPAHLASSRQLPMPIVLLFDFETLLLHPEARFSNGDPRKGASTFATPAAFAELPFDLIYHDSWLRTHEREEIMRYREAQVLLPNRVTLESLQYLWVRSPAEYETLRHSLSPEAWARWSAAVTTRTDMALFNHRRPYIRTTSLTNASARLLLNPCHTVLHENYRLLVTLTDAQGVETLLDADTLLMQAVELTFAPRAHYTLQATIDGHLAYCGAYTHTGNIL